MKSSLTVTPLISGFHQGDGEKDQSDSSAQQHQTNQIKLFSKSYRLPDGGPVALGSINNERKATERSDIPW